jgi:hypothetical protein
MKITLTILSILFAINTFAQPAFQASIGPQIGFPVGKFVAIKTGVGAGIELAKPLKSMGSVTLNIGFLRFATKSGAVLPADLGFVNIRAGYRTTATLGKPYIGADAGLVLFTQDFTSASGISYSIGPGYLLKMGTASYIDLSIKFNYNNRKWDNRNFNWIGLRAAFGLNFGGNQKGIN